MNYYLLLIIRFIAKKEKLKSINCHEANSTF